MISDVLLETGDDDENIPAAEVRIGIDSGRALVVNNRRNGNREPLFLGRPANMAAKIASNRSDIGIYLSNEARKAIGLEDLDDEDVPLTPLTEAEIADCQEAANLGLSKDSVVSDWRADNKKNPIGAFAFTRAAPPLRDLDLGSYPGELEADGDDFGVRRHRQLHGICRCAVSMSISAADQR
ncbi:hypothetical protein NKH57_01725 [Mesorhizobium sp. M1050]|uniref:hypothetical protein n=1 Tax=Mesorhizobium sp. M1050 TaxID=2957051 RepID=UPI003334EC24